MHKFATPLFASFVLFAGTLAAAPVNTQVIEYKDGDTVLEGFLATPQNSTGPLPAILVVHEWWGLNDYARERATQLAEAGYVAFAVDIYGQGRRSDTYEGAGKLAGEFKNDRLLTRRRGDAALEVLRAQPQVDTNRLAAIGYCFGGMCVLEFARGGAPLAGVVSFHGSLDTPIPAQPGAIHAKVLICHGAADPFVPATDVAAIEQELTAAGADWQLIKYSGAVHSFTSPRAGDDPTKGAAYNPAADHRSWQLMSDFFTEIFKK